MGDSRVFVAPVCGDVGLSSALDEIFLKKLSCLNNRKMPKISPEAYIFEGLIFGGAYIRRGLFMEGNLRF